MDKKTIHEIFQQKRVEKSIREEFEQTCADRVARYLQVKPPGIVPYRHFSRASVECSLLFRDGHFYGCIALTQAVAEALVRFLCQRNSWRLTKVFETNVKNLSVRNVISDKLKDSLLKIWEGRNDYHHLNPNVEADRRRLEGLAKEKVCLLVEVESDVFSYTTDNGKMIPKHPKYWDAKGNMVSAFLWLDP